MNTAPGRRTDQELGMKDLAESLRAEVAAAVPRLQHLSDRDVTGTRGAGRWVKKEILGHLIDSASNNHQRFIRAQTVNPFVWPGYEQEAWVDLNHYRDRPWTELVVLWEALNRHLAHVIANVRADSLGTRCTIGDNEPVTLEWLMRDYVVHLRHHLAQIVVR